MSSVPNDDAIEDYLFSDMGAEESRDFRQKLDSDPALQQALALYELEHRAIELDLQSDLRRKLDEWKTEKDTDRDLPPSKKRKHNGFRRRFVIMCAAASILLVIGFFALSSRFNDAALASGAFAHSFSLPRSQQTQAPQALLDALGAWQTGETQQALNYLDKVTEPDYRHQATLITGEIYFEQRDFPAAAAAFEEARTQSTSPFLREVAEWNLGLTLLSRKNTNQQGRKIINSIANNPEHNHAPSARKLLERMESFWGKLF